MNKYYMDINNFDELIKTINQNYKPNNSLLEIKDIVNSYKGTDWINYIVHSGLNSNTKLDENKNYYKNCVYKNNLYDIYVVSWMPNKKSPVHDHPKNGCLFKVLKGNLKENKYTLENLKLFSEVNHNIGNISYISNENYYHSMINEDNEISVSLHIYSPPNYIIKSFTI